MFIHMVTLPLVTNLFVLAEALGVVVAQAASEARFGFCRGGSNNLRHMAANPHDYQYPTSYTRE